MPGLLAFHIPFMDQSMFLVLMGVIVLIVAFLVGKGIFQGLAEARKTKDDTDKL